MQCSDLLSDNKLFLHFVGVDCKLYLREFCHFDEFVLISYISVQQKSLSEQ